MFAHRESCDPGPGTTRVEVAFTDARTDFQRHSEGFPGSLADLVAEVGVPFARLTQEHGNAVVVVLDDPPTGPGGEAPAADALVTPRRDVGLMIRVADCVPVLLADPRVGVVGAAHAGRNGVALDVVGGAVAQMRELGAHEVRAWIGPHVCGRCYEVPEAMREEIARAVPAAYAETRWGTPSLDLGAAVAAQLRSAGVADDAVRVIDGCTLEDQRFHSHRRDGARAGRFAGLVWQS